MATLIPTRNSCLPRMTSGEKRVSERLEQKLEDDYLIWYDVPVGLKQRHPDFVIVHPRRGLLVLEVKDWKAETIQQADSTQFTLITDRGTVKENNPLLQARAFALEVGVVLQRDPALHFPPGHRHAGKLVMPWGWGVVLANISRKQFDEAGLEAVIPPHLVICRDEIYETVGPKRSRSGCGRCSRRCFRWRSPCRRSIACAGTCSPSCGWTRPRVSSACSRPRTRRPRRSRFPS
jgi:hypothetical protein